MELKFKNKEIFLVLSPIWVNLFDYKFKTHINSLVTANSDDEFEQTVTVSITTLSSCYFAVSQSAYGNVVDMANDLLVSLRDQLIAKSNITEYTEYQQAVYENNQLPEEDRIVIEEVTPNEYTQALLQIVKFKEDDATMLTRRLNSGKEQILA